MQSIIKVGSAYRNISDKTFCFIVLHCQEEKGFFEFYVIWLGVGQKIPKRNYYRLDEFSRHYEEI